MTPQRQTLALKLLESALERPPEQRGAFLEEACGGDAELRAALESLLSSHEKAGTFLESPELVNTQQPSPESLVGQRIGAYKVLSALGRGGMGEVYLAQDVRLGRRAALKILRGDLALDPERLRRFRLEATAASALNHPNILTIYDIGEEGPHHFIAAEHIEGQTLRGRLETAKLAVQEAVEIALQVASALAAAHEAGVVHRDIKPENIMLRPDGYVKVLDFGLAKLTERPLGLADTALPTIARAYTERGMVMGTFKYMSPEQARGLEVDARTDIFSLGVVLYEMISGRAPFEGETPSDVMAAVLQKEPSPLGRWSADVSAELERIVARTLAKDRDQRYAEVGRLLADLKRLKQQLDTEPMAATGRLSWVSRLLLVRGLGKVARFLGPLLLLTAGLFLYLSTKPDSTIHSLAILPFLNEGTDPDLNYLSDGIAESLINNLSRLSQVRVIARTSAFRYKGGGIDPIQAGRDLNAEAVVTGRVTKRSETLVIQADLIHVAAGTQLWGDQYTRELKDVLAVQREISKRIAENLGLKLTDREENDVTKRYTESNEAYHLYLQGKYFANKRTREGVTKAIEYYDRAIQKDPNYALAYCAKGDAYSILSILGYLSSQHVYPQLMAAGLKALELDESLGEAHSSVGHYQHIYEWNWSEAERRLRRGIDLNPNYPDGHHYYGHLLEMYGRTGEAIAETQQGLDLDPLSLNLHTELAFAYYLGREYERALELCVKAIEMDPNFPPARMYAAYVYRQKKMYPEAIVELDRLRAVENSPDSVALLAEAYAASGRAAEAEQLLVELVKKASQQWIDPARIAYIHIALGDNDAAFQFLEKAHLEKSYWVLFLKTDPRFDPLRSDPRFEDLLRRFGFPE